MIKDTKNNGANLDKQRLGELSADTAGSRQGKIVLVQHHGISDPDTGGSYTVKRYSSKKKMNFDETWQHEEIILEPLNKDYQPIILSQIGEGEFKVIAELVCSF